MSKQYGLIKPQGHKIGQVTARPSVFGDDSDSETEIAKPTGIRTVKKQDKINQDRAVEEDPTVYQYDEIYDEMDQKRKESILSKKDVDKKPKYIGKLLVAAERRKRENERRIERQVQKEREEEGEEFKDKESFVTSAYKKKLEEMRELEEQEKREEYLESIGDVTKQGNLDGFYRHLYDQKLNVKSEVNEAEIEVKKEEIDDNDNKEESEIMEPPKKVEKKRKYRSRKESQSDDEQEEIKKEHLPSNLDADSDFSIDSSDSEEEKPKIESEKTDKIEEVKEKTPEPSKTEEETKIEEKTEETKPKKPKIDIWKKRTVGHVFDEALKRYYERKSQREAG